MTLVCESLGGGENALPLAPLVEFCHNASLIHDDIEDNSDQRRGKPAVHKIYGMDASINSGCFLYFLPLYCIESWAEKQSAAASLHPSASGCPPSESTSRLYRLWAQYMRKLHLGQAMDINWHKHFLLIPSLDDYYTMCALKTGCLARFAAALGVFAAYGTDSAAKTLGQAAEKLGVGFQILDDVKNLTGGVHGKKRGDDIVEGKKSLPALLFLHRQPEKRDFVFRCFKAASENGIQSPEVEEVIEAFAQAGVLEEAKEKGMKLIAEAREIFQNAVHEGFTMKSEICALLAGLTQRIS
jgi:octaprenyl-diphosphate synthase